MRYRWIKCDKQDNIAKIAFSAPRGNALSLDMLDEIQEMVLNVEKDDEVEFVLLISETTSIYSSGLDLRSLYVVGDRELTNCRVIEAVECVRKICEIILSSNKIYTTCLNGGVIGSAVAIAMACDIRIATDDMWIWVPDSQYGGYPGDGCLELLKVKTSPAIATNILLSNNRFSAGILQEWGIILRVVPADEISKCLELLMEKLQKLSHKTLCRIKTRLNCDIKLESEEIILSAILNSSSTQERLRIYLGE